MVAVGVGVDVGVLVTVGVSVGCAIAVAVISAKTVARISGAGVAVWVTVGEGVIVGSDVGVTVGETARSETSFDSSSEEDLGGPQLRHKAITRANATGFHNLVVFTQPLFGYPQRAGLRRLCCNIAHYCGLSNRTF